MDVLIAGGCTVDIVHAADGSSAGRQPGGSAIYAAVGARVWGLRPGVIALRGTGLPDGWEDLLRDMGCDLEGLVTVPLPVPVNEFFYDAEGRRTQRPWAPGGTGAPVPHLKAEKSEPIRQIDLSPARIPGRYLTARGAHLAPMRLRVQREFAAALAGDRVVTLDPYPHAMAEASDADLGALLLLISAFLPSEEEISARYPASSPDEAAASVARLGAMTVVVKRGTLGSTLYDASRDRLHRIPALPVPTRDPTGAGDAFCGGFLAGMVERADPVHAALCGTVAASFVVEDFGVRAAARIDPAERDRRYAWLRERIE